MVPETLPKPKVSQMHIKNQIWKESTEIWHHFSRSTDQMDLPLFCGPDLIKFWLFFTWDSGKYFGCSGALIDVSWPFRMYSKLKTSNSIDFWDLPESITSHVHHPWAQICPISEAAVLSLRRNRRWSTRTHREGRIPEWLHNVTNYIPTLHPVEDCHRGGGCQPALGNVDQSHLRSGIIISDMLSSIDLSWFVCGFTLSRCAMDLENL